jgi:hypothetical protein
VHRGVREPDHGLKAVAQLGIDDPAIDQDPQVRLERVRQTPPPSRDDMRREVDDGLDDAPEV